MGGMGTARLPPAAMGGVTGPGPNAGQPGCIIAFDSHLRQLCWSALYVSLPFAFLSTTQQQAAASGRHGERFGRMAPGRLAHRGPGVWAQGGPHRAVAALVHSDRSPCGYITDPQPAMRGGGSNM